MKITVEVESLRGTQFEIEVKPEDTVAHVKKNIKSVSLAEAYPASQLMLFHQGKVLIDSTTLDENKVAENPSVSITFEKNESSSGEGSTTSSAPTTKRIPEHAEVPHVACAPTSGLAPNSPAQPQQPAQPAPVPSSGSNANVLECFPQGLANMGSNAADGGDLDFLSNSPQFQVLRTKANPQILTHMLEDLGNQNHDLLQLLINKPVEGGEGNISGQLAETVPQAVEVTRETIRQIFSEVDLNLRACKAMDKLRKEISSGRPLPPQIPLFDGVKDMQPSVVLVKLRELLALMNAQETICANTPKNVLFHPKWKCHLVFPVGSNTFFKPWQERYEILRAIIETIIPHVEKQSYIMNRAVYYKCKPLLRSKIDLSRFKQETTNFLIWVLCQLVGCTRESIYVIAADKGRVVGRFSCIIDGNRIDFSRIGRNGMSIPGISAKVSGMTNEGAKFVLVVEKETIFSKLAEQSFFEDVPCILLTGKGQPDLSSRRFLWRLRYELKLPVLCLVDCDPYGVRIMATYKYGTQNTAADNCRMVIGDVKWLGILPSELGKLEDVTQPMTGNDLARVKNLAKESFVKDNGKMIKEMAILSARAKILEIDCIGGSDINELSRYLKRKIMMEEWI